jgi:hypothetical protein
MRNSRKFEKPVFVELFSGSGHMSEAARNAGFNTVTVDIEQRFEPDICIDILNLRRSLLPGHVDVIWASVPCTVYSVLSSSKHWDSIKIGYRLYNHAPKTSEAIQALRVLRATIRLIVELNPRFYFIENPRGVLRHRPEMLFVPFRREVRYSDYGFEYEKPTDIFTNCEFFKPVKSGRPVGLKQLIDVPTAFERSLIPPALCEYVANTSLENLYSRSVGLSLAGLQTALVMS